MFILILTSYLFAQTTLHLDPEMTGEEYQRIFKQLDKNFVNEEDALKLILEKGQRNLNWVKNLQIDLWNEENTVALPVEAPSFNSRSIIAKRDEELRGSIPQEFFSYLDSSRELPGTTPFSIEDHANYARAYDRLYQSASRWLLQEPSLGVYRGRRSQDLRGAYFFKKLSNPEEFLQNWESVEEKEIWTQRLLTLCLNNNRDAGTCSKQLENNLNTPGGALKFFKQYSPQSYELYENYFKLGAKRSDIKWDAQTSPEAFIPFKDPQDPVVQKWLVDNIEAGWQWQGSDYHWQLKLEFQPGGIFSSIPWIVFQPGATPNVNGLAGNRITMDANRPMEHYSTKWTLKHEFGHVLGFPDCYIEFYDDDMKAMVNYQLDTTDIMCSRRGKLKQNHYDELKKNYFN